MESKIEKTPEEALLHFLDRNGPISEGFVVETIVEVVINGWPFRLEAIKSVRAISDPYDVNVYAKGDKGWERFTTGQCNRDTAAGALMQALSFLSDAFRNKVS